MNLALLRFTASHHVTAVEVHEFWSRMHILIVPAVYPEESCKKTKKKND